MSQLLPDVELVEAYRVVGYSITPNILEPDVLLRGDRSLLMIEAKTAMRHRGSHKVPPEQILHYALLPILARQRHDVNIPRVFALLLLLPGNWRSWLIGAANWAQVNDRTGQVVVDVDACIHQTTTHGSKLRATPEQYRAAVASMPIFAKTWEELARAIRTVAAARKSDPYDAHWSRLVTEISALSSRAVKRQAL